MRDGHLFGGRTGSGLRDVVVFSAKGAESGVGDRDLVGYPGDADLRVLDLYLHTVGVRWQSQEGPRKCLALLSARIGLLGGADGRH